MNICVAGLWHLGSVTAACLAAADHHVVGYDPNQATTTDLNKGKTPVLEQGLSELVSAGMQQGRLRFTSDRADALRDAEIVWITYDTPVDDDDNADSEFVLHEAESLFPYIGDDCLVLISSQLPVGSTRRMEQRAGARKFSFAYSPENLRLGKAIETFIKPERLVVGVRRMEDRPRIAELLTPFTPHIEWMSVESAEMTKHALNSFLATSVAFINEIAGLCERVGADAKEVERGLKSEKRIGPHAYLGPGAAFSGGTLARDLVFLSGLGREHDVSTTLISSVKSSNDVHREWPLRRLRELLGDLHDQRIAILGLTYKPGTDTLRRSSAIELCRSLVEQGAKVTAHDPAVSSLPENLTGRMRLAESALGAAEGAAAVVIMTEWPEYKLMSGDALAEALDGRRLVLDANRFLAGPLADHPRILYAAVGKAI